MEKLFVLFIVLSLFGCDKLKIGEKKNDLTLDDLIGQQEMSETNLSIDALTGYHSEMTKCFNIFYSDLIYGDLSTYNDIDMKGFLDRLEKMSAGSEGLSDEYFNFKDEIDTFLKYIENKQIIIVGLKSNEITDGARFIYPEPTESKDFPVFCVNFDFIDKGYETLVESSIFREIIIANRFFFRVQNNTFTRWDEVENLLYLMDGYYGQAHFIEKYFESNRVIVTSFEKFLLYSYSQDTLDSFFLYYFGIDRSYIVHGVYYLNQLRENKITLEELINAYNKVFNALTPLVEGEIQDNHVALMERYSLLSYYIFLLGHVEIQKRLSVENRGGYDELYGQFVTLYKDSISKKDDFQKYIRSYRIGENGFKPAK